MIKRFIVFFCFAFFVVFCAFQVEIKELNVHANNVENQQCPVDTAGSDPPIKNVKFSLDGDIISPESFFDSSWIGSGDNSPTFLKTLSVGNLPLSILSIGNQIDKNIIVNFIENLGIVIEPDAQLVGIVFYSNDSNEKTYSIEKDSIRGFSFVFNIEDQSYHEYYQRSADNDEYELNEKYSMEVNGDMDLETIVSMHYYTVGQSHQNSRLYSLLFPGSSKFENGDTKLLTAINFEPDFFKDVQSINQNTKSESIKRVEAGEPRRCGNSNYCPRGWYSCTLLKRKCNYPGRGGGGGCRCG